MAGFTPVFGGGGVIYPAQQTFIGLALTANTTLQWPLEQQVGGSNIAAAIVGVTATAGPWALTLSSAQLVSNGYAILFDNYGANSFVVKDAGGNTLLTVASGEAWVLYLRDNSTDNGVWRSFQQGAGTSSANAASLAGSGLKAILTTLNEKMSTSNRAVNYAILDADRANVQAWTGGSGGFTLPDPATVGADWFVPIKNNGGGSLTVTSAAGTIDGSANVILSTLESAFFISDGANYYTLGLGQEVNSVFDFISINVAGTGDFTLAGAQLNRISYELTGVLTGNRNIIVPSSVQQYWIDNETTGAFTLTVKTAAGAGVVVPQGARTILYCDGTDVIEAISGSVSLSDGSAASPALLFTLDPDTGLYRVGANTLGVTTGGTLRWSVSGAAITSTLVNLLPDGTVGNPAASFTSDPDTGIYRDGANSFVLVTGGILALRLNSAQQTILGGSISIPDGLVGTPAYTWTNDQNTGVYRIAGDYMGFTAGGVLGFALRNTGAVAQLVASDGTVAAPIFSFDADTDTGFYRTASNQIAISLGGVTAGQIAQGTFTGTLTGMTGSVTGTVNYQRIGKHVHLWLTADINGTSNNVAMTMTGLPAIIQTTTPVIVPCMGIRADGLSGTSVNIFGFATINGGTITFASMFASASAYIESGFTAASTKGLNADWTIQYPAT